MTTPNSGRKLFFGLFVFPLLIAVGMAILLCSVVLVTNEVQTSETLIASIKTGSPGKRWQKAFELSNELNRGSEGPRNEAVMNEMIHILGDAGRYDPRTRGYMALALSHFNQPESTLALKKALRDENEDVRIYALWSLGTLRAKDASQDVLPYLKSDSPDTRKVAAYVLGVIAGRETAPLIRPLLEDPVHDTRWNAALALARLGDDAGFEVLVQMLRREDLAKQHLLSEEEIEKVMISATKGLALIRRPESITILESIASSDKNLKIRQAAMDAVEYQKGRH